MNAIAAPKSRRLNLLEGMALTALFQAIPTFGAAVLLLQLVGSQIVGQTGGAAIFVATATLIYALATPWLGPKFPRWLQERLRTAVLRCDAFVHRKAVPLADPAGDLAATRHQRDAAVVVAGRRVWGEGSAIRRQKFQRLLTGREAAQLTIIWIVLRGLGRPQHDELLAFRFN